MAQGSEWPPFLVGVQLPVDPKLREQRRRRAAIEGRRRVLVAIGLAICAHLVGVPLFALVFTFRSGEIPPPQKKQEVSFVEIPAQAWDSNLGGEAARQEQAQQPRPERQERPREPEPEPAKPEKVGQVVETAPGNDREDPNARLAAETANQVERETIARDRAPGEKVTMPRRTTDQRPPEEPPPAPQEKEGDGLALGDPGSGEAASEGAPGTRLEIPSTEERERIALKPSEGGEETIANREASEAVEGNSDRFRLQVGEGEGQAQAGGPRGQAGQAGQPLRLFPDRAELAEIAGGPAPDHVDGVEEGDGTFLNTREWKYASFFNRVKRNVSENWDPVTELRKRDPTGQVYAYKDRHTLLSVTLGPDGRIRDVWVQRSSGLDFLDREAVAAFERAQPFPNPPRGLFDESGAVQFQFGFYLELGRPAFRLFR